MRKDEPVEGAGPALSAGGKVVAVFVGFLLFWAAVLGVLVGVAGPRAQTRLVFGLVQIAIAAWIVSVWVRGSRRRRSAIGWAAVGFAAGMVVFGGCFALIATGRIRIAG